MIDDSDGLLLYDPRQPATLTACRSLQPDGHGARRCCGNNNGSDGLLLLGDPRQLATAMACSSSAICASPSQGLRATLDATAVTSSSSSAIRGSDSVPVLCDSRWPKTGSACRSLTPRHQRRATCSRSTAAMGCRSAPIQGSPGQQCLGLAAARGVRFRSDAFPITGCSSSGICGSSG
ncbi:hypothetical protein PR202_gb11890 [Eleusine coracana subsp. coracana]|uniref:Uncharacterized protein n=1 Tax=Eleusine coracana subsp. coracana TaxID=191504 RepID=A0AAV5EQ12_ELECO|nr:hypothetical protein PR202_gb11890 [Eleusine coracana subsp. coracana]